MKLKIGIIPDGNRTWQKKNSDKSLLETYHRGAHVGLEIIRWALARKNVERLVFYGFSVFNHVNRPIQEMYEILSAVSVFMLRVEELRPRVDLNIFGDLQDIEKHLRERKTAKNPALHVDLLINYSAEWDFAANPIKTDKIPDLDFVVRTSGVRRLSGFLPWQSRNAELFFPPTLWPDFDSRKLEAICLRYEEFHKQFLARGGRGC